MSHQAVKEYLSAVFDRYQAAKRGEKILLLNEAQRICNLSRRQIRRHLTGTLESLKNKKSSGRPKKYPRAELNPHIRHLWLSMERVSAKRMKVALIDDWLGYYTCEAHIKYWLATMSASTLARFIKDIRGTFEAKKGIACTSPARFMKNKIPLNTFDKKIDRPGYTQTDTVAHCGTSIAGNYAHSITLTDLDSTWTENRAVYCKKAVNIREQFVDLRRTLPFELIALNSDSGSEFLNLEMLQFTDQRKIAFTRSRPYKKNDNCYVEEKNFTHVRELFGYERIEDASLIPLMNEIYKIWNPFQNYFIPTFKLIEKYRIGSRVIKKYGRPKTPYQRLMESEFLTPEQKQTLRERKALHNPFKLKAELEEKLSVFFSSLKRTKIREVQL